MKKQQSCNSDISSRDVARYFPISTQSLQLGSTEGRAGFLNGASGSQLKTTFLARNSVAVAPAFAHCTNRCTRRKVIVTAQSTKQENRKMKKRSQHENTKLPIRSPRAALLLLSQSFWWGADEQSQDKPSETKFISIDLVRSIRKRRRLHGRRWTRGARTRSRPRGAPKKTC